MTQRQSFGVLIAHGIIALALLASAAALCALGKIDAAAFTGLAGAVLGFAGGAGITQGQAIINGGPKPDYTKLGQSDPDALARLLTKVGDPLPATRRTDAEQLAELVARMGTTPASTGTAPAEVV